MPLPGDVGTGVIHVKLRQVSVASPDDLEPELFAARGKVHFSPTVDRLLHGTDGSIFATKKISVYLDANGDADVTLTATDDPQVNPVGYTYLVEFELDDGLVIPSFHVAVPVGSDRNLSDITPVPYNGGVYYLNATTEVSTDAANYAVLGSDGKIYVPIPSSGGGGPAALISAQSGNYIVLGSDGKLYAPTPSGTVTPSSLVSVQAGNSLTTGTDSKLYVPPVSGSTAASLLSANAGNYTVLGTDSKLYTPTPATPIIDHGALTGLADDDHPQYHNDTRGDIRYYLKAQVYTRAEVDALLAAAASAIATNNYTKTQTDSAITTAINNIPASGSADVHVVLHNGSAYETLPGTPNPAWRVIEYRGPAVPTPPTAVAYAGIQFDWRVRGL
jgi:hypothetical protein